MTTFNHALAATALALGVLSIGACQNQPLPPSSDPMTLPFPATDQVLRLGDLGPKLRVDHPTVIDARDRPLTVSVPVKSVVDYDLKVLYKYQFYDVDGRRLSPEAGWTYLTLVAQAPVFFEGSALDDSAVNWRLIIRPSK